MNHVHEDQLLLLAYGELPEAETAAAEQHLAACARCRAQLLTLERARIAYDWVTPQGGRRPVRWAAAALAAAVLAAVLLARVGSPLPTVERVWPPAAVWSPYAGYMAGGANVLEIDAQLTRLEQERYHGLPD